MGQLYQIESDLSVTINQMMVKRGFGKPYNGGRKSRLDKNELVGMLVKKKMLIFLICLK